MRNAIEKILEEHKFICCDGTTSMVMDTTTEDLEVNLGKKFRWNGRTIYLYDSNDNPIKVATLTIYKERIVEGMISSIESYKLFIK